MTAICAEGSGRALRPLHVSRETTAAPRSHQPAGAQPHPARPASHPDPLSRHVAQRTAATRHDAQRRRAPLVRERLPHGIAAIPITRRIARLIAGRPISRTRRAARHPSDVACMRIGSSRTDRRVPVPTRDPFVRRRPDRPVRRSAGHRTSRHLVKCLPRTRAVGRAARAGGRRDLSPAQTVFVGRDLPEASRAQPRRPENASAGLTHRGRVRLLRTARQHRACVRPSWAESAVAASPNGRRSHGQRGPALRAALSEQGRACCAIPRRPPAPPVAAHTVPAGPTLSSETIVATHQ